MLQRGLRLLRGRRALALIFHLRRSLLHTPRVRNGNSVTIQLLRRDTIGPELPLKMRRSNLKVCPMITHKLLASFALFFAIATAAAQEGPLRPDQPQGTTPENIIQKFAANEQEFRSAWEKYTYRQDIKIQTLDGDTPDGEFRLVYDIVFDDKGQKHQDVKFAPASTITRLGMDKNDYDQMENIVPFSLSVSDLPKYNVIYVGQQKEDELDTYVFDVAPKQIVKNEKYFQGRVWVEQRDLQIVMTRGKLVPETRDPKGKKDEALYPDYTTYREQIDGKYWFPTYSRADETLHFSGKNLVSPDVHLRATIKFTNYRRFGSDVKIEYGGKEVEKTPDAKQKPPRR